MRNYIEKRFNLTQNKILGIDEAGRGNIAGPMIVAGCILNLNEISYDLINEINDSKKLSKCKREFLYEQITKHSIYDIEIIDVSIINKLGPKRSAIYGMNKIVNKLKNMADFIFIDYEKIVCDKKNISFIHGDAISLNIAAASILAKVYKDNLMKDFINKHPKYKVYEFDKNAGYGTKQHLLALQKYGKIRNFHRENYKPVQKIDKFND